MKMIIAYIIIIVLLLTLSFSQPGEYPIKRTDGSIYIENENYLIDWNLDIQGYSPHSGKFIVEGNRLISKNVNRTTDIAIVSPTKFKNGTRVLVEFDDLKTYKVQSQFDCPSPTYGWDNPEHTRVFCNVTNNDPLAYFSTIKYTFDLPEDYLIISNFENASIIYNVTHIEPYTKMVDYTPNFQYAQKDTQYGTQIYYLKDVTFTANKEYTITFELETDISNLPIKYTVCFGNIETSTLFFCLDPTIVNSRTWTTTADFTNKTTRTNISTSANELKLNGTQFQSFQIDNYLCWSMDNVDVSGTTLKDRSPKGNDGVISGSPVFCPGKLNQAFCSDYVNDKINSTSIMGISGNQKKTVAHWTWVNSTTSYYPFVSMGTQVAAGNDFTTLYYNNADFYLGVGLRGNDLWTKVQTATNSWYLTTATHDGSIVKYYRNVTQLGNYTRSLAQTDKNLLVGYWYYWNKWFWGKIDELYVWNRTLSLAELATLYNNGNGVSCQQIYGYRNQGIYSDRQGWTPQTGGSIKNVSVVVVSTATSTVKFRYNNTNASLDTSAWTTLSTNGTNTVVLSGLGTNDAIYYQFLLQDTSTSQTPKITSYTLNEGEGVTLLPNIWNETWNESSVATGTHVMGWANVTHPLGTVDTVWFEVEYPNGTRINHTAKQLRFDAEPVFTMEQIFFEDFEDQIEYTNWREVPALNSWKIDDGSCASESSPCFGTYCVCSDGVIFNPDILEQKAEYQTGDYLDIIVSWQQWGDNGLDAGEGLKVWAFNYTTAKIISTMIDENGTDSWEYKSINLSDFFIKPYNNISLRFDNVNADSNEELLFDNVEINGTSLTGGTTETEQYRFNITDTTQCGTYTMTNVYANDTSSNTNTTSPEISFEITGCAAAGADPCKYTGSGIWHIDCSDNCFINSSISEISTLPDYINFTGTGEFIINNSITTNFTTMQTKPQTCTIVIFTKQSGALLLKP